MTLSEHGKGDMYIYVTSILWALFPIVTVLTYLTLEPLPSLALSTLFAAIFFAVMVTVRKKWHELRNTAALRDILYVTLFIGVGFYFFIFMALKYTSAGNVSLVGLLEILFSYLFFSVWKKEEFSVRHIMGSLLMIAGAVVVLLPNATIFNIGDFLVIVSVMLAPFGNYFQRRARLQVSSEIIMFVRSLLTTPVVFVLAFVFGQGITFAGAAGSFWFLLLNGVLLLGFSKILWIEAIHRVSVTRANALSSISPLLTLLFAYLILGDVPTVFQLASFVPLALGLWLLTR